MIIVILSDLGGKADKKIIGKTGRKIGTLHLYQNKTTSYEPNELLSPVAVETSSVAFKVLKFKNSLDFGKGGFGESFSLAYFMLFTVFTHLSL